MSSIDQENLPRVTVTMVAFTLSTRYGVVLAGILVGMIRSRDWLLFTRAVFVLVTFFTLFLFVDGIVSGPYISDVGLVCGGAMTVAGIRGYDKRYRSRKPASR